MSRVRAAVAVAWLWLALGCGANDSAAPPALLDTTVPTSAPETSAVVTTPPGSSVAAATTQPGTLPLLLALDAAAGVQRFAVPVDGGAQTFSGIVVSNGVVAGLGGRCDGQPASALGFDAMTGTPRWAVPLPGAAEASESVSTDGGILVLATWKDSSSVLSGIDVASGRLQWEVDLGANDEVETVLDGPVVAVVQQVGDPSGPFQLTVFDRASGERLWERSVPGVSYLAAAGDVVLLQTSEYQPTANPAPLLGLDAATGAQRWQADGVEPTWTPAVGGGVVVDSVTTGGIVAFDLGTGMERWRRPDLDLPEFGAGFSSFAAGYALLSRPVDFSLEVVDLATGQTAFPTPADGQILALVPEALLAGAPPNRLSLYGLPDGSKLGQVEVPPAEPDQVLIQPAVGPDGTVYLGRGCPGRG